MAQSTTRETAEIIPFPTLRTRKPASRGALRQAKELLPHGVSYCDAGSGWYHEAAVAEDQLKHNPH